MKTKIDWKQYEKRVAELENEGLCTSDAQSVADVEFAALDRPEADPSGVTLAAHTRLIAAAPDLLEVARDYVLLCQLHDIEGAVLDSALAAIAKVEGMEK